MIFIEGVDGSGKTTLIKKLNQYGYINVIKGQERILDKNKEYNNWARIIANSTRSMICDRSPITEFVYREVDGEPSFLYNSIDRNSLNTLLLMLSGSLIIYCSNSNTYNDAMERGDNNIPDVQTHMNRVDWYDFVTLYIKRHCKSIAVLDYNWYKDNLHKLSIGINKYITGGVNAVR